MVDIQCKHTLSHFVTHLLTHPKVRHTSRTPRFLVVHAYIHRLHMSLQGVFLVRGDFCSGILSGFFCLEGFVRPPPVIIHMLQQKYRQIFESLTSLALGPLPLSQTVTPSRTSSPLERDVLYGRPLCLHVCSHNYC